MLAEAPKPLVPVWRTVRQLLPVYAGMAQRFDLPAPPFDLAQIDQNNDHDAMLRIAEWLELIDDSSQPHHLRSALQETGAPVSDLCLQIWIQHFVSKPVKTSCDRDKIDFLLVQYLCLNMPPSLQDRKPTRAEITAVLEPVLGACDGGLPEALGDLDALLGIAERCRSLQEFEQNAIIPHGRELKFSAGDLYFSAPYLLAFTHFNAVVRGECLRLMNADLKFVGEGLEQLQRQGVQFVDCSAAGWSDREPLFELKKKWATWELASGDYSTDFYTALIGFRAAIEEALAPSVDRSITAIWDEMCSIRSVLVSMQAQIQELARMLNQREARPTADGRRPTAAAPLTVQPAIPSNGNGASQNHLVATQNHVTATQDHVATESALSVSKGVLACGPSAQPTLPANGDDGGQNPGAAAAEVQPAPAAEPPVSLPPSVVAAPRPAAETELPVVPPASHEAAETAPLHEIPVEVVVEKPTPPAPPPPPAPSAVAQPVVAQPVMAQPPPAVANQAPPAPQAATESAPATDNRQPATDPQPATDNRQPTTDNRQPTTDEVAAANLNDGIVKVQKILAGNGKRTAAISIAVSGTRVLLTPAEVAMFSDRESACAGIVQRAVVARLYLVSALETYSKTRNKTNLAPLIALAKTEQTSLTTAVAECKAQKRGRDEEILAATGKQLAAMLERAARIAR
ncbi:MAG TPA: hypothetical protein VFU76_04225 [Terriglobales bacterium]|nr:hypothetical protein [Terriglobales bacterium]